MQFYSQFLFCLTLGLVGLCGAMKVLFETLLNEWDPIAELREAIHSSRRRRSLLADWDSRG